MEDLARGRSVAEQQRRLRGLALNDEAVLAPLLGARFEADEDSALNAKTCALVRLAAVVVLGAPPVTYQWATQVALAAGATDDEIVGTLIAVAPVPGVTRAVSAAPELAIALGYDVDEALESGSTPRSRGD
jgi:4-carboxymuconolactone decarboxylase